VPQTLLKSEEGWACLLSNSYFFGDGKLIAAKESYTSFWRLLINSLRYDSGTAQNKLPIKPILLTIKSASHNLAAIVSTKQKYVKKKVNLFSYL
jgi:hypothetical protein